MKAVHAVDPFRDFEDLARLCPPDATILNVSESDGHWYAVRCVFLNERREDRLYEERITLWRAGSMDEAIAKAEAEAQEYAVSIPDWDPTPYIKLAQGYHLFDEPGEGAEVFSLMRESKLAPDDYLDQFFDTGTERTQVSD